MAQLRLGSWRYQTQLKKLKKLKLKSLRRSWRKLNKFYQIAIDISRVGFALQETFRRHCLQEFQRLVTRWAGKHGPVCKIPQFEMFRKHGQILLYSEFYCIFYFLTSKCLLWSLQNGRDSPQFCGRRNSALAKRWVSRRGLPETGCISIGINS